MRSFFLCTLALTLIGTAIGADPTYNESFVFPSASGPSENFAANVVMTLGSIQNIQFITALDSYYIALFQQTFDPPSGRQLDTVYTASDNSTPGSQSFNWRVQTYDSKLSDSNVYFLWLNPGSSEGFSCHYFNISSATQTSSTSSSTTTTSTTSSVTSTSSMATNSTSIETTPTATGTPAASSSGDNSSSVAIKVGLGVGLGIGIPLVLIAAFWLRLQAIKQRRASKNAPEASVPLSQYSDMGHPPDPYGPKDYTYQVNPLHEAPAQDNEYHEMSSQRETRPAELRGS